VKSTKTIVAELAATTLIALTTIAGCNDGSAQIAREAADRRLISVATEWRSWLGDQW
jgi:hypothetical protein